MKKHVISMFIASAVVATGLGMIASNPSSVKADTVTEAIIHGGDQPLMRGYSWLEHLRNLPDGSRWRVFRAIIGPDGTEWFDLGDDQLVQASGAWLNDYYSIPVVNMVEFQNDPRKIAVIMSDEPATLWTGYGQSRVASGRTMPVGSAWLVTTTKTAMGKLWYQIGPNEYLLSDDVLRNFKL
ncbi:MAG: hypothetical protein LKF36_14585 [Lactobacillus sp.]|jgi:hypothetical protein|nr:hypothetical protein [Lactobacillus sp.]